MKLAAKIRKVAGLSILTAVLAVSATARPASADTGGACLQQAYGSSSLNCTANDVHIASVQEVLPALDSNGNDISGLFPTGNGNYMCIQGSQIQFTAYFTVTSNASQRYDIGLYIADGQKSARTGTTCNRDYLRSDNSTPYDNFTQPQPDACGDVSSSHSPYTVTMLVKTTCQGAGSLALPNCTSWLEKEKTPCTGMAQAIPGAPSKCNCDDYFTTDLVQVVQPSLAVNKSADKTSVDPTGEVVTYTATVKNLSTDMTVNLTRLTESSGTNQSCTGTPDAGLYL